MNGRPTPVNSDTRGGKDRRLWLFVVPIAIWALHFLVVYVSAAIYCARAPAAESLSIVRLVVLAATVAALALTGRVGHGAWRRYRAAKQDGPGGDSEDRFVGSTVLMLCLLSMFATLAVASVALLFGDCRS